MQKVYLSVQLEYLQIHCKTPIRGCMFAMCREVLQAEDIAAFESFLCQQLSPKAGADSESAAVLSPANALSVTHAWVHAVYQWGSVPPEPARMENRELVQRAETACLAALLQAGPAQFTPGSRPGLGLGSGSPPGQARLSVPEQAPGAGEPSRGKLNPKPYKSPKASTSALAPAPALAGAGLRLGAKAAAVAAALLLQLLLDQGRCPVIGKAAPAATAAFWATFAYAHTS